MHERLGWSESALVEGFQGEYWHHLAFEGGQVWHRRDTMGFRTIATDGTDWFVDAGTRSASALTAVRVCRELLRTASANVGGWEVHAAFAVTREGLGLLFTGDSGAGKTTAAFALAQCGGVMISSDVTTVIREPGGAGLLGVGAPQTHRLRTGTIERLVGEGETIRPFLLRDRELTEDGNEHSGKAWLTALEAQVLLRVPSAPAAVVDRVVILEAHPGLPRPDVHELSEAGRRAALDAQYRPLRNLHPAYWLDIREEAVVEPSLPAFLEAVGGAEIIGVRWDPFRHTSEQLADAVSRV